MVDRIIALAVVVVLAVSGYFLFFSHKGSTTGPGTQTTVPSSNITTTLIPPSSLPTTTVGQGRSLAGCLSQNNTQPVYNGNFSTGTYAGWSTNGIGFGPAPTNITYADQNNGYYGQPWSGYNGTFFATTYQQGTSVESGNLTSAPFQITEPYINFKIISPQDDALYVQIMKNGVPQVTIHYNTFAVPIQNITNNTNQFESVSNFFNATIVAVPLLCENVSIRIHSGAVGVGQNQFNFIAVTNFYQSKKPVSTPGIIVNQTYTFS